MEQVSTGSVDAFDSASWVRLEFEETPIYVRDCPPCWLIPNVAGDRILRDLLQGGSGNGDLETARFLARLPEGRQRDYPGRSAFLSTPRLRELWIHLTNRCNMACRHCLFASSPDEAAELSWDIVLSRVEEAVQLGCRVFALTGGEPFIHPAFDEVVDAVLAAPETHVVVLTNGSRVEHHAEALERWGTDRFHLQISLDGLPARHDAIRGTGAFSALERRLAFLNDRHIPFTLSMCVDAANVNDMPGFVEQAAKLGATNVHFMWLFLRGRAGGDRFAAPEQIFPRLREADERAHSCGLALDNIEALKTQVFAPPGTIHDGTTSGWESAALGPDGKLYPSAALVGVPDVATDVSGTLEEAWLQGKTFHAMRRASAATMNHPLRFLLGGGDSDHSYSYNGTFVGNDPYWPLYEKMALWLMARNACRLDCDRPGLRLKMGDILESCGAHGPVALVHSNCLLATAQDDSRTAVKSYYSEAAVSTKDDILNPACYPEAMMAHIPAELRFRGYGCGSPVLDAEPQMGDTVVDLGCGRGIECFLAARAVGADGRVIGIDMLDPMLELARSGVGPVSENLGYTNLDFRKGYLEELPLEDGSVDLVLSNCVLNLSADKRRTFGEVLRVLKPGGRLVVSDVVTEQTPDAAILNDEVLRGECIAGALTQRDLAGILEETGFQSFRVIKRVPYRDVQGHRFFSMTYEAARPERRERVRVLYRGPMRAVVTPGGQPLFAGLPAEIDASELQGLTKEVAVLDKHGVARNMSWESSCACAIDPDVAGDDRAETGRPFTTRESAQPADCMVCGKPLIYLEKERETACVYCGTREFANAVCEDGHYICDQCHSEDALTIIRRVCQSTEETDMLSLMQQIRSHPGFPLHGPEHHSLVPGVILATYRNLGGTASAEMLDTALRRGNRIMGGSCAFLGSCGAAIGVGTAFSLILDATPLTPTQRQLSMRAVNKVAEAIADVQGARCCQRDVWIALKTAATVSEDVLPVTLKADATLVCRQQSDNPHCIGSACPLVRDSGPSEEGEQTRIG